MQYTSITSDITQILALLVVLTLLVKPFGGYMQRVYEGKRTFLSPVLGPLERVVYRISGIGSDAEMNWKQYASAMLIFNGLGMVVLFSILMLQGYLPLNPSKFPGFLLASGCQYSREFRHEYKLAELTAENPLPAIFHK